MSTIALQRLMIRRPQLRLRLSGVVFAKKASGGEAALAGGVRERSALKDDEHSKARRRSEGGLIRAAQDGSQEAVEVLFRRHWPRAHRAAYLVVRDSAAAEDIAQEAFLAAIRTLGRFDRRRAFSPWLHRIVVNRAIDWTRARSLRHEVGDARAVETVGDEGELAGLDIRSEIDAGLAELSPEHRAVVVLRYLLGYTPGEIAQMLELPRGTVNSRLRRALDRLAAQLGEEAR